MTTPSLARDAKGRTYCWPPTPPFELEVPSVTNILGRTLNKNFLQYWRAKVISEWAVDNRDTWASLPRDAAVDLLKREPFRQTYAASDRGTAVHDVMERVSAGEAFDVATEDLEGNAYLYAKGGEMFLNDFSPEFVHVEATAFSSTWEYAGTSDAFARIPGLGLALLDYKTSKAIYPETALQLHAYAYADFLGFVDGTKAEVPKVDILLGVRLGKNDYEVVPIAKNPDIFDSFLALRKAFAWYDEQERIALGDAIEAGDLGGDE